ncbi:MAG: hypothetical protein OXF54_07885 [Caldilineaceae bacterium]|nr:hypothetical protein [Caldilineaceae bacterium]
MADEAQVGGALGTPRRPRILDVAGEARLVQLACSAAPDGQERWTLQKLVELEVVERSSRETVPPTRKKTNSNFD